LRSSRCLRTRAPSASARPRSASAGCLDRGAVAKWRRRKGGRARARRAPTPRRAQGDSDASAALTGCAHVLRGAAAARPARARAERGAADTRSPRRLPARAGGSGYRARGATRLPASMTHNRRAQPARRRKRTQARAAARAGHAHGCTFCSTQCALAQARVAPLLAPSALAWFFALLMAVFCALPAQCVASGRRRQQPAACACGAGGERTAGPGGARQRCAPALTPHLRPWLRACAQCTRSGGARAGRRRRSGEWMNC
jgi:hypothetical protein